MKTNYLNEELLQKLSQIPLKPLSLAEGIFKGFHFSKLIGEEAEFKEFRPYVRGDDLKKVDWKLSARQNQFFVRELEEQLNYTVRIFFDKSASMKQKADTKLNKIEYSKYIVAALTYLFLKQGDQVQISAFDKKLTLLLKSTNNVKQIPHLIEILNKITPSGQSQFQAIFNDQSIRKSEKTLTIVISDFITDIFTLLSIFKKKVSPKNKFILFHIISLEELEFDFKGDIEFIDPETKNSYCCQASQVKKKFLLEWNNYLRTFQNEANYSEMEYRQINCQYHYSENILRFIQSYHLID